MCRRLSTCRLRPARRSGPKWRRQRSRPTWPHTWLAAPAPPALAPVVTGPPVDFVCEEDVRQAVARSARIAIGARTIVTPSARELGEAHGVFVEM